VYKPINGWTKKEIIKVISNRPNAQSVSGISEKCVYRGVGGNMCAVGAFIPDDLYYKSCEEMPAHSLVNNFTGLRCFMPLDDYAMQALQSLHDCSDSNENINSKLIEWVKENVKD
jgi:hypothetical protein